MLEFLGGTFDAWVIGYIIIMLGMFFIAGMYIQFLNKLNKGGIVKMKKYTYYAIKNDKEIRERK